MCVSGYISKKNMVGRSLSYFHFFSKISFIIFPDFNKKHNRCVVCPEAYNEKGSDSLDQLLN